MTAVPKLTNRPIFRTVQPSDLRTADINKRVIAFIIDIVISSAIAQMVKFILIKQILHLTGSFADLLPSLFSIAYFVATPLLMGASLGKKAFLV